MRTHKIESNYSTQTNSTTNATNATNSYTDKFVLDALVPETIDRKSELTQQKSTQNLLRPEIEKLNPKNRAADAAATSTSTNTLNSYSIRKEIAACCSIPFSIQCTLPSSWGSRNPSQGDADPESAGSHFTAINRLRVLHADQCQEDDRSHNAILMLLLLSQRGFGGGHCR